MLLWELGNAIYGLARNDNNNNLHSGEVRVKVSYKLTEDNSIAIYYQGMSNLNTLLNMTSHTYFNLNGHNSG